MTSTSRTAISLPRARYDQLAAIAHKRDLPSPAALIECWISRAIDEGELPEGTPGFYCQPFAGGFQISIAGHVLPIVDASKARMLAALMSAAAGEPDPKLTLELPAGRPVALDLGEATLGVGRGGRGVRFVLKGKDGAEGQMIGTSPAFVAELAATIRRQLGEH